MPKSVGHLLAAAVPEDVGLVLAVRADEVAHVLDDAERRDVQLLYIAIARRLSASDTCCGVVTTIAPATGTVWLEAERHVAGAGRQIDRRGSRGSPTPLRGRTAAARRAASDRAR